MTQTTRLTLLLMLAIALIGCGNNNTLEPANADPLIVDVASAAAEDPLDVNVEMANDDGMPAAVVSDLTNTVANTGDCPTDAFQAVEAHPANAAYPDPILTVSCTDSTVVVTSNGIPNFEFVPTTPNNLAAAEYVWEIPLEPAIASETTAIPLLGTVGFTVNGIPIFGPNEAANLGFGDPYLDEILDFCNGHTGFGGTYHVHARPECIFEDFEGNTRLIVGYALDGFPILAPFVCEDAECTIVTEVQSSWQRTSDVREAWEAHEYIAGSGDLDACNGMTFADGSYAYFATDTFPYFVGCYTGTPNIGGGVAQDDGGAGGDVAGAGGPGGEANGRGGPNGGPNGGAQPDLAAAAAQLGVSEAALEAALGAPPPDFALAAAELGVSEDALRAALGVRVGGGGPSRRLGRAAAYSSTRRPPIVTLSSNG